MCGIVGAIGDLMYFEEVMFKEMLMLDMVRGIDGTGVISVDKEGRTLYHKSVDCPPYFFAEKGFETAIKGNNNCLIGHNRAATKGKVVVENSHPFYYDPVVGVHNGTLTNQSLLPDHKKFATDSENIFYSIALEGIDKTWKNLHGAATLVWFDVKERSLNIIRNDKRPMSFRYNKDKSVLFFASEPWMITIAARRNDIKLDENTIFPKPNILMTFKWDLKTSKYNKNLIETVLLPMEERELTPFQLPHYYGTNKSLEGKNKTGSVPKVPSKSKVGQEWIENGNLYEVGKNFQTLFKGIARSGDYTRVIRANREEQGEIKALPAPATTSNSVNKDIRDVGFLNNTLTTSTETSDRENKRKSKKALKAIRKKHAIARRMKNNKKTNQRLSKEEEYELEFYDKYGHTCVNDRTHPLDPQTAEPITQSDAVCAECFMMAESYGVSVFGLKGA